MENRRFYCDKSGFRNVIVNMKKLNELIRNGKTVNSNGIKERSESFLLYTAHIRDVRKLN